MSIAVILPTYNSMKFLRETLQSVLDQTLQPTEILLNDDASHDGTPEFAERFIAEAAKRGPVPKLRVFRRGGQRQAASRNYAATQTSCEWIAFLDHDDLWVPNKLERQMQELQRTGADLCYSSLVNFRTVGSEVFEDRPAPVPPVSRLREALFHSTTFLPSSVVLRRSKFLENGGFRVGYKVAEDWELWLRLYHAGLKFAVCEEPLLRYRIHGGNQSSNALVSLEEAMEVYDRLVVPHLPASTRWMTRMRTRSAHQYAAALALRNNGDDRQIGMLLRSLVTFPFAEPHRYKVLAHMSYMRATRILRPTPVQPVSVVPFPQTAVESVSRDLAA